ncbi:hypothetical protein [[Eubacterium] cellulosolvens]
MKALIFYATPLIYLCRIGQSEMLSEFSEKKYVTLKVFEDLVEKGKRLGAPDAFPSTKII